MCIADGKGTTYIGSSVNCQYRFNMHRCLLRHSKHPNRHLQSAWNKYAEGAFLFGLIETVGDTSALIRREQHWLDRVRQATPVYNCGKLVGRGISRALLSSEHCRKIGKANKGRRHTAETRRKMSLAQRGRKKSPEHVRKVAQALTGKKLSEETKAKISRAKKGKDTSSPEGRRRIGIAARKRQSWKNATRAKIGYYPAFIHRETGEIIPPGRNIRALCRERNLRPSNMYMVKNGQRKSHREWMLWIEN